MIKKVDRDFAKKFVLSYFPRVQNVRKKRSAMYKMLDLDFTNFAKTFVLSYFRKFCQTKLARFFCKNHISDF